MCRRHFFVKKLFGKSIYSECQKNFDIHYKCSARMRTDFQRNFAASRHKSGAANDIK